MEQNLHPDKSEVQARVEQIEARTGIDVLARIEGPVVFAGGFDLNLTNP